MALLEAPGQTTALLTTFISTCFTPAASAAEPPR
jgi:hypothetical protein